jgi:hypothetical protein
MGVCWGRAWYSASTWERTKSRRAPLAPEEGHQEPSSREGEGTPVHSGRQGIIKEVAQLFRSLDSPIPASQRLYVHIWVYWDMVG